MKTPAQVDYEEKGHPALWGPGLADQKARDDYDELLAEQTDTPKASS